ncbi:PIF1 helicase, partial [Pseudoatta argentina]
MRSLNNRDCDALEAAETLLGNTLHSRILQTSSAMTKAMKYHERLEEIQSAFEHVAEFIEKREDDLKTIDRDKFDDKTIKHWIRIHFKKTTGISALTGIPAFNINGLTIHTIFQLPVIHKSKVKYTHLSDMILKTLRDKLKTVELFIIDEVSIISNVTFMFINLRLCEIFDTIDTDDGFKDTTTHIVINLSRIRIGLVTNSDINVLQSRKIYLKGSSCDEKLNELCTYMNQLLVNTICLLPTCYLCKVLNMAMVHKILEDKVSETAGIEKIIVIKIGTKVMIRQNIDVTLGLVNGTIGNVIAVNRSVEGNLIDSIKIVISDNKEIIITKVDIKFKVFHKMVVHRKQFLLSLSYGITIRKSQGITCKNDGSRNECVQ